MCLAHSSVGDIAFVSGRKMENFRCLQSFMLCAALAMAVEVALQSQMRENNKKVNEKWKNSFGHRHQFFLVSFRTLRHNAG